VIADIEEQPVIGKILQHCQAKGALQAAANKTAVCNAGPVGYTHF
jgi:hypothetical protein